MSDTIKILFDRALAKYPGPINPMDRWLPGCPNPFAAFVAVANGEPYYQWKSENGIPLEMSAESGLWWLRRSLDANPNQEGVVPWVGQATDETVSDFMSGFSDVWAATGAKLSLPVWAWLLIGVAAVVAIGYTARSFK